jgi:uncharacterized protein (DUF924 family)
VRAPQEVLEFWFSERVQALWFEKSPAFDEEIRVRFGATVTAAGELEAWSATPQSALARVIVLDQFPRNIFRGTPRAFAADAIARRAADAAIARGFDGQVPLARRFFFYMPFEHSEDATDQRLSVALFRAWAEAHDGRARDGAFEILAYALRHHEVIERFGRFPHRNAILGRASTPAEIAFLEDPSAAF